MAVTNIDIQPRTLLVGNPQLDEGGAGRNNDNDPPLAPVRRLNVGQGPSEAEIKTILRQMNRIATEGLADPGSLAKNKDELINIIEKLMLMLAKEEGKAKHDRYDAKMSTLEKRIGKMLASAKKTLEAGKKELEAISTKSAFQLIFAIIAIVIIIAAIVAAIALPGIGLAVAAALIGAGAAIGGILMAVGSGAGELAAKGATEDKQALNEESANLNALATKLEKLMENESELSSEAKELLRKLLEILMKIFDRLNASKKKSSEAMGS